MQKIVVYNNASGDEAVEAAINAMVEKGWRVLTCSQSQQDSSITWLVVFEYK